MIKKQVKGTGPRGTFLEAAFGNEVVDACNAFIGMEIVPARAGRLVIKGDKAKLRLPDMALTYGSLNGTLVANWIFAIPEPNAPGL